MNCRDFQDRLYEYVEGSLPAAAQSAAERHLAACSACRQAVRKEQQLAQSVSNGLRLEAKALTLRPEIRSRILSAAEVESRPLERIHKSCGDCLQFGLRPERGSVSRSNVKISSTSARFEGLVPDEVAAGHRPALRREIRHIFSVSAPVRESIAELWSRLFRLAFVPACVLLIAGFLLVGHLPGAKTRQTEMARHVEPNLHPTVSIQISYRVPTYKFHQEGGRVVDSVSDETVLVSGTFQPGGQGPVLPNPERKKSL